MTNTLNSNHQNHHEDHHDISNLVEQVVHSQIPIRHAGRNVGTICCSIFGTFYKADADYHAPYQDYLVKKGATLLWVKHALQVPLDIAVAVIALHQLIGLNQLAKRTPQDAQDAFLDAQQDMLAVWRTMFADKRFWGKQGEINPRQALFETVDEVKQGIYVATQVDEDGNITNFIRPFDRIFLNATIAKALQHKQDVCLFRLPDHFKVIVARYE